MAVATAKPSMGHAPGAGPWCPPTVSFCQQPKVKESSQQASDLLHNLLGLGRDSNSDDIHTWRTQPSSRFLSLPLEIRRHIYEFVHLMNPAPFLKIKSLYPMPTPGRCFLKPLADEEEDKDGAHAPPPLMSPYRPASGLPTSLLLVSKQVYNEARLVPLANNEFVYVNWFSSGIWAAHFFTRHLQPWQSAAIRFVRLEMLAGELGDDGHGIHRWTDVCEKWAPGLQGLRLRVVGGKGAGILPVRLPVAASQGQAKETTEEEREQEERARRVFGKEIPCRAWVDDGLVKLRALRHLEIEMALPGWSAKEKLAWCARLEEVLREKGMRTSVVCVERVAEPDKAREGSR